MTTTIKNQKLELTCEHDISIFDADPMHAQSYKLKFEILETNDPDIPKELFLFRKVSNQLIKLTNTIKYYDKFVTVCSVADIYTYPAGEPDGCMKENYFRKSTVEGVLNSLEECYRVLNRIKELLTMLLSNERKIREHTVKTPAYKITEK
jgi:hypothetical protein